PEDGNGDQTHRKESQHRLANVRIEVGEEPHRRPGAEGCLHSGTETRPNRRVKPDRRNAENESENHEYRDCVPSDRRQIQPPHSLIHVPGQHDSVQQTFADVDYQTGEKPAEHDTTEINAAHAATSRANALKLQLSTSDLQEAEQLSITMWP